MTKRILLAGMVALPLAACDAASDIAGEALGEQVRTTFVERCEQIAADNGVEAAFVADACDCAADNFAEDLESGELTINREVITEMALSCAAGDTNASDQPAGTSDQAS